MFKRELDGMSGHTPDELLLEVSRVNLALATGCHYSNGCAMETIPHDLLQMISGEYMNLLAREHLYRFIVEYIDSRWPSEVHYDHYEFIIRFLANEEILKDVVRQAKHYNAVYESEGYIIGSDILVDFAYEAFYAILKYASPEFSENRDIVLDIVKQNGRALQYASEDLCADPDVVLAAVKNYGYALEHASPELREDRDMFLTAVRKNGGVLECASEDFRDDREIVLAAVKQNGDALICASRKMKEDREVVLAAVKQDGNALQHASQELRGDQEVVLAAVQQDGRALRYASPELRVAYQR